MTQREAFGIPACIPLEGPSLQVMRQIISKVFGKKYGDDTFVPDSTSAREHSRFGNEYEHIRLQTEHAFQHHVDKNRELVCALILTDDRNAFALSCETFDAVLVTTGLILEIQQRSRAAVNGLFNMPAHEDVAGDNFKTAFKTAFPPQIGKDAALALHQIMYQTVMNCLLGHEFGHLARGHIIKSSSSNAAAVAPEGPADIELLASDAASAKATKIGEQAFEVDADVQGMRWAKNELQTGRRVTPASETQFGNVFLWIQDDPARIQFVLTMAIQLMYVSLGAAYMTVEDLLSDERHPPTSLRVSVCADSMLLAALSGDAAQDQRAVDYTQEARWIVAVTSLVTSLLQRADDDPRARMQANAILKAPVKVTARKAMNVLGLEPLTPERRLEAAQYLADRAQLMRRSLPGLQRTARWDLSRTVNWSVPEKMLTQ